MYDHIMIVYRRLARQSALVRQGIRDAEEAAGVGLPTEDVGQHLGRSNLIRKPPIWSYFGSKTGLISALESTARQAASTAFSPEPTS